MSENVTPDICTKKAISTNQVAPLEKINGILPEKVQSQIYSSCRLHSLIALHIALLPLLLGEQVFCFFPPLSGHKVRTELEPADARLVMFALV